MRACLLTSLMLFMVSDLAIADARWTLDFKVDRAGTIVAKGAQGWGNYLYLIATLANSNGRDVPLSVGIDALTDVALRSYRGGHDPAVAKALTRKLGVEARSLFEVRGTLGDGASTQVLVVFGRVDANVDRFSFQVEGLRDRVYQDQYQWWVEDSILQVDFDRLGDEFGRQHDLLRFKGKRWHGEPRVALKRAAP